MLLRSTSTAKSQHSDNNVEELLLCLLDRIVLSISIRIVKRSCLLVFCYRCHSVVRELWTVESVGRCA